MPHLRLLASTAVVAATLISWPTTSAHAEGETCDGKQATIVVTSDGRHDGTNGDDVIVVLPGVSATVGGLGGNDTICGAAYTQGGPGDDDLWSGAPVDQSLACYFCYAVVNGDAGDDVIHGNDANEALFGGDGNDTVYGNGGDDILHGDVDRVWFGDGVPGNDTLNAGPGDDVVVDAPGDDTLLGGPGSDTLALSIATGDALDDGCANSPAEPTLDIASGTVSGLGNDTFHSFSDYTAEGYADATILGSSAPDHVATGDCGKAHVYGKGGNDTLTGDSGLGGVLSGGGGDDRISITGRYVVKAGPGDDRIRIAGSSFAYDYQSVLAGGHGTDWLIDLDSDYAEVDLRNGISDPSTGLRIEVSSIENARVRYPSHDPLSLGGTAAPNTLIGPRQDYPDHSRQSVLRGRGGNDRLIAGSHDTAYGGPGRDYCRAARTFACEAP